MQKQENHFLGWFCVGVGIGSFSTSHSDYNDLKWSINKTAEHHSLITKDRSHFISVKMLRSKTNNSLESSTPWMEDPMRTKMLKMQQEIMYCKTKKNICTFSCSKWKISREKYENVVLFQPSFNPSSIPRRTPKKKNFLNLSVIIEFRRSFNFPAEFHSRFLLGYLVRIDITSLVADEEKTRKNVKQQPRGRREKTCANHQNVFHLAKISLLEVYVVFKQMKLSTKSISEIFHSINVKT